MVTQKKKNKARVIKWNRPGGVQEQGGDEGSSAEADNFL
jgi:hypothetical protein